IDQKLYLDTRHFGRHRWYCLEIELRKAAAVFDEFALALQDMDLHVGLTFDKRAKHLSCAGGNCRISSNNFRHIRAHGFDSTGKRSYIEVQPVALVSGQNVCLYGGSQRDNLIGVQLRVRYPAEQRLHAFTNKRNSCGPSNHDDFVDFVGPDAGVLQRLTAWL